jgi:hypothetical protein
MAIGRRGLVRGAAAMAGLTMGGLLLPRMAQANPLIYNPFTGYPITDGWQDHLNRGSLGGIDFGMPAGTNLPACGAGTVTNTPFNGTGGHTVTIQHANGYRSQYLHLSAFTLANGTAVAAGAIIGRSGGAAGAPGSGSSTGPHLHWHMINPAGTRIDPLAYIAANPAPPAPGPRKPGLARFGGNAWTFYTTDVANGTGITYRQVTWPGTLASDRPLVGDWSGSGRATPGLARFGGNAWTFYTTDVTNGTGVTYRQVTWPGTLASDRPLVGDWSGSGRATPGLARFGGNAWTFYTTDVANGTGVTYRQVTWPGTLATDVPLAGDWSGSGRATPGLARFTGNAWIFYTTDVSNGTGVTYRQVTWPGTLASDRPLVGDWTGSGKATPGLARFGGNAWTFYTTDVANGTGVTYRQVTWPGTLATDVSLAGGWT